jgi:opacity protein-like surface antigen
LFAAANVLAQEKEDSTKTDNGWWGKHHRHHFNIDFFKHEFEGMPTISLDYGFSKISSKNFSEKFADPNLIELRLGYTTLKDNEDADILDYKFHYLYISNFSTDLSGSSNGSDLKTNMWRFGFGRSTGYGYKINSAAIIPYHTYSFEWTRLKMKDMPVNPADQNTSNLFNQSYRFGTSFEGGVRFKIIKNLMIDAGYERSIVFPRHLFWKWAGSIIIEAAGQGAIDRFVDKIVDSSPYAAPVVSFVLKNALSYGIYELRQEKMNWPFSTPPPLAYNQFKIGLTFVF